MDDEIVLQMTVYGVFDMKGSLKISVLIPAYKRNFLKKAIESVLCQSYVSFELIIVDDCSPEKLDEIVESFHDERIRYYKNKENIGGINVVENWNKCLEYAEGEYVLCMGDDDELLPNCLLDYVGLIEKFPMLEVYHMRTYIVDENSNIIGIQEARAEWESVYSLMWHRWNGCKQFIGDFLFRKDSLVNRGGFFYLPTACCSDDISVVMAAKDHGIANTYRPGFLYRDNNRTISNDLSNLRDRYQALVIAQSWYESFLIEVPNDSLDQQYQIALKKMLDGYIGRMKEYCMKTDIGMSGLEGARYWLSHRKFYGLSLKRIIRALICQ